MNIPKFELGHCDQKNAIIFLGPLPIFSMSGAPPPRQREKKYIFLFLNTKVRIGSLWSQKCNKKFWPQPEYFLCPAPLRKEKKRNNFLLQKSNNWKTFWKKYFWGPKFWGMGVPPGVVGWCIWRGSVALQSIGNIYAVTAYASMRRRSPQVSRRYLGFMTSLRGVTWHMEVGNGFNFTGQCTYIDCHPKIFVTIAQ